MTTEQQGAEESPVKKDQVVPETATNDSEKSPTDDSTDPVSSTDSGMPVTDAPSAAEATVVPTQASSSLPTSDMVENSAEHSQSPSPVSESPALQSQDQAAAADPSMPQTPAADASPPAAAVPDSTQTQASSTIASPSDATQPVPAESVATASNVEDQANSAGRARGKLEARSRELSAKVEETAAKRPETPVASGPVSLPETEDLDASLESEIQAAMGAAPDPVVTAPVDPEIASQGEEQSTAATEEIGPGSKISGTVAQIHGDDVFVEAGIRNSVVVSLKQFAENKRPSVGSALEVTIDQIDPDGLLRGHVAQARHRPAGNWDALAVGQIVDCNVTGVNKGGLQVSISSIRGFLPASQVDLGFVENLESFVGQKLSVQITEVNPRKKNLVVSRRALLQAEREEMEGEFWKTIEIGQEHSGIVKTIKNYGAFINIGAIDGFLHVGEMSWSRINHPNEVLSEGQQIQVKILKLDPEKKRVSLGMKQLVQNPWHSASERYPSERIVTGKVTRIADFGAFVELEPGIEGLVHISELAWKRVGRVSEVLSVGEERDFKVLEVDPKRRRVSMSLKALEARPEAPAGAKEDDEPNVAPRKPNPDLRGGTSGSKPGGGLFGNPRDFS